MNPQRFSCDGVPFDRRQFLGAVGLSAWGAARVPAAEASSDELWSPREGANQPMGEGQGLFPGRVVWLHDPRVAKWDGDARRLGWFDDRATDPVVAERMVSDSLRLLTGASTDAAAWAALFRHHNVTHGRGDVGYQPGELVTVKLNLNCSKRQSDAAPGYYNTPQVSRSLLRQLVQAAGVRPSDIVVYDASRLASDPMFAACHAEFPEIRFEDRDGADGRFRTEPDKQTAVYFSDGKTPDSGRTFLPKCVTRATYLINAAVLKGHSLAGATLCAKNHFGSVFREDAGPQDPHKGWNPSHMHDGILVRDRVPGSYNPLVDLMGHRHFGGKTILYLLDALYAAPHQSVAPERWESAPFNGHWTASLLLSQDPVAIDSVGVDFLAAEPTVKLMVGGVDDYLHEAALADRAPSQTRYTPEGTAASLSSLGVHEHWDSPQTKRYSRNLGLARGIELVRNG